MSTRRARSALFCGKQIEKPNLGLGGSGAHSVEQGWRVISRDWDLGLTLPKRGGRAELRLLLPPETAVHRGHCRVRLSHHSVLRAPRNQERTHCAICLSEHFLWKIVQLLCFALHHGWQWKVILNPLVPQIGETWSWRQTGGQLPHSDKSKHMECKHCLPALEGFLSPKHCAGPPLVSLSHLWSLEVWRPQRGDCSHSHASSCSHSCRTGEWGHPERANNRKEAGPGEPGGTSRQAKGTASVRSHG